MLSPEARWGRIPLPPLVSSLFQLAAPVVASTPVACAGTAPQQGRHAAGWDLDVATFVSCVAECVWKSLYLVSIAHVYTTVLQG